MKKDFRYGTGVRVLSVLLQLVSTYIAVRSGMGLAHLTLIGLAVAAAWIRFRLEPYGTLNLSPVPFFVALLLDNPYPAALVGGISSTLASVLILKRHVGAAFENSFGENLAALITMGSFIFLSKAAGTLAGFSTAVLIYATVRVLMDATIAFASEGIATPRYLSSAAWRSVANIAFFGLVAFSVDYFLYGQFGIVAVILATVTLAEIYHPWKLLSEQNDLLFTSLAMIAQAIDVKDPYTASHSRKVAEFAVRIARALRLPESEVRKIRIGALMHDIGKIGVSGTIIRKPSRLEPDEERAMRSHPIVSANIMQPVELLAEAAEIVRHHHEHYDGSGYPEGLEGEQIPIGSRIILVADAFDAMTTDRPYRKGRSKNEALDVLRKHSGKQFDRVVVDTFESVVNVV